MGWLNIFKRLKKLEDAVFTVKRGYVDLKEPDWYKTRDLLEVERQYMRERLQRIDRQLATSPTKTKGGYCPNCGMTGHNLCKVGVKGIWPQKPPNRDKTK